MADRVAVITGSGTGIGRASALALMNDGWSVVLCGRRKEMLEETAGMKTGGKSLIIPTDVTDPAQVDNLFEQTKSNFGRIDMLFNNAGGGTPTTNFGDFTCEMWLRVVQVNLNASFLCANAAFRMMRDQSPHGGRIINNGSISAHVPRVGSCAYTSPNMRSPGLPSRSRSMAGAFDICSCQIDIGNAATPMTARSTAGQTQPHGQLMVEPRMDVNHVGQQALFMSNLPLKFNVAVRHHHGDQDAVRRQGVSEPSAVDRGRTGRCRRR